MTRGARRAPVVVLSHELWRSRCGSDPAIVGQRIALGRQRFEVVGVTEPHAQLTRQELVSFWAPLTMADAFRNADVWSKPDARTLGVIGRLRENVTATSMRAWLEVWLRDVFPHHPTPRRWPCASSRSRPASSLTTRRS